MSSKKKKQIIYPIFQEAANSTDDEFWKNFFMDLACNNAPKRFVIDKTTLKFYSKKDGFIYYYVNQTGDKIANEVKTLLNKNLIIYSDIDYENDIENKNNEIAEYKEVSSINDWKKIKHKKTKNAIITRYVLSMKEAYELNWKETNQLYNTIISAFFEIHSHKSTDIVIKNGQIISIKGISIIKNETVNSNKVYYNIKNDRLDNINEKSSASIVVVSKIDLMNEWKKLSNVIYKQVEEIESMTYDFLKE